MRRASPDRCGACHIAQVRDELQRIQRAKSTNALPARSVAPALPGLVPLPPPGSLPLHSRASAVVRPLAGALRSRASAPPLAAGSISISGAGGSGGDYCNYDAFVDRGGSGGGDDCREYDRMVGHGAVL